MAIGEALERLRRELLLVMFSIKAVRAAHAVSTDRYVAIARCDER